MLENKKRGRPKNPEPKPIGFKSARQIIRRVIRGEGRKVDLSRRFETTADMDAWTDGMKSFGKSVVRK